MVDYRNKSNVINFKLTDFYIPIYLILIFLNFALPFLVTHTVIFIYSLILLLHQIGFILREHWKSFITIACLLVVSFGFSFIYKTEFLKPIYILPNYVFFIVFIRYKPQPKIIKYLIYLYASFVIYTTLLLSVNMDDLFQFGSRNMVAWFIMGICVFYYISTVIQKNKIDLGPALITLFISIISNGRTAIFTSSLLFLAVLYLFFKTKKNSAKIILIAAIPILILFIIDTYGEFFSDNFYYLQQKKFESNEREYLIESYFSQLNLETFLSGVPTNVYPFSLRNGNFHNSFLLGHSLFGVFFLFFLCFIFSLLVKNIGTGKIEKIFIIILLLRATTDTIMFVGFFDFVLFILMYNLTMEYKNKKRYRPFVSNTSTSRYSIR